MKKILLFGLFLTCSNALSAQLTRTQGFFKTTYAENGVNITKEKAETMMQTYDLSKHHYQIAKKNEKIAMITSIISTAGIVYILFADSDDGEVSGLDVGVTVLTLGSAITGLVTSLKANKSYAASISDYNLQQNKVGFKADLMWSGNRVGLVVRF